MYKFDFNKREYEEFCDKAMLNDELKRILELKIKGYSTVEISFKMNMSESTVKRRVKELYKKIKKIL